MWRSTDRLWTVIKIYVYKPVLANGLLLFTYCLESGEPFQAYSTSCMGAVGFLKSQHHHLPSENYVAILWTDSGGKCFSVYSSVSKAVAYSLLLVQKAPVKRWEEDSAIFTVAFVQVFKFSLCTGIPPLGKHMFENRIWKGRVRKVVPSFKSLIIHALAGVMSIVESDGTHFLWRWIGFGCCAVKKFRLNVFSVSIGSAEWLLAAAVLSLYLVIWVDSRVRFFFT